MQGVPGDRLPQRVAEKLQRVPAVLVQHPATAVPQLGEVRLNLAKLLDDFQLTTSELQQLIRLLLRQDITQSQLANNCQDTQQQADQQQPAGTAIPAANQQPHTVDAAAAAAQRPGRLPWHTLILNQQPLGIEGLAQLFSQLDAAVRLKSLGVSDCDISGSLCDDVLGPYLASCKCFTSPWFFQLQWLDVSHNPKLLGPENINPKGKPLETILFSALGLQGLCLQHTGFTSIHLHTLLVIIRGVCSTPGWRGLVPLGQLQCLKLGPVSPDSDNSAAAAAGATDNSSQQTSGWPDAAFNDLYQRLEGFVPPFHQLVVLELYGLSKQQLQHIVHWADRVSQMFSRQPSLKAQMMISGLAENQPHIKQPQPDCCRISWLKPGQVLAHELPTPALDWRLPPPERVQTATPAAAAAAAAGVNASTSAHTAAMPSAVPAVAVRPFAAGAGWTFPPPPAAAGGGDAAAGGGGGAAAAAASGAGGFRSRQPQQAAAARASAAAAGFKSVLDLGGPGSFVLDGRQQRTDVPLAAAAGDIPRSAQQHTSRRQQRPRQRRDRHQHRVVRHNAWQPGINDYADQTAYDAAAMDEDWQHQHEEQQHDNHAVAAFGNVDDDFMDSGNSRQWQRQPQRRQRPSPSMAAAAAAARADQGTDLGSQHTMDAALGGSPKAGDGGILADLIQEHQEDLFSESDDNDQMFRFAALRANGQADKDLRTAPGSAHCQQQPTRRRRKKRILQPVQFDDYGSSPAAAAAADHGVPGCSPAHRLPPLESPSSDTGLGLEDTPPDSWQQQQDSRDSPTAAAAATGRCTDDEDDVPADVDNADIQLDPRWIADDNDKHLRCGMYSQDEASQDSGSEDHGDRTLQQRQQQRRRDFEDDDDPKGLRAFDFERKRLDQGFGIKGLQLFGTVKEGEKRRQKALDDPVQAALQRIASKSKKQQSSGEQALGQEQQQLQQQLGGSAGTNGTAPGTQNGKVARIGAKELGKSHRRSKGGRNPFVDDAAGGGGAYGHEEDLLTNSSSSSSEDGRDSDPPVRHRRLAKSKTAGGLGVAAADMDVHDYDVGGDLEEADESSVPTAAAARGGSKHRSQVVLNSEPQDEPDPLDAVLQHHYEQQQQQRCQETREVEHAAHGGGIRRTSRVALLDSEPQDEPDPLDAVLQQHFEQQQQQRRQEAGAVGYPEGCKSKVAILNSEAQDELDMPDALQQQRCQQQQQQPGQLNPAPAHLSKGEDLASKAVQRSISTKPRLREAATSRTQRQRRSADSRLPGIAPAAQTAAANQPAGQQSHGNVESASDDEAPDQPEDLDSIPEIRQWKEADAELQRLEDAEQQLLQTIQAAQATAAAAAVGAAPETVLPAPPAATLIAGATAVREQTAPSADLTADSVVDAATGATTAAGAGAAAVAVETVGDRLNSLQQQLKSVTTNRKRQQRLVKLLKGNIPWHWDKRGPDACSFHINKVQDSKRQSRAPTRLSPGAIEQQERLMRLAQQQQQQEVLPLQPAAAHMSVTLPVKAVYRGTKPAPASRHRSARQDCDSASGYSSSTGSDSQDDVPLATLYQKRRNSTTQPASSAGGRMGPGGCCPGEARGSGANSSDDVDRLDMQQHQQHTGGETRAQLVPAVAKDPSTSTAEAAAAARDRQSMQPPADTAALQTAAGDDGSSGWRRTSRVTAGKASKEFSKVFGSDYYKAAGAAIDSSPTAAAESGQADGGEQFTATGLRHAAVVKLACPLTLPSASILQPEHKQQQPQDCVTTVPAMAAAAASGAATAAVVAQHTISQPGHNVSDVSHNVHEPSATPWQQASAAAVQPEQQLQQQQSQGIISQHSSQQQLLLPQQPQKLLPQQSSQQEQETMQQQHQLDPERSAACGQPGVIGVTDILQGPVATAQAQQHQAPDRHSMAFESALAVAPHAAESAAAAVELADPGQVAAAAPSPVCNAAPTAAVHEGAVPPAVRQEGRQVGEAAAAVQSEQKVIGEPHVPHFAVEAGLIAAALGASLGEELPELVIPDSEEEG